MASDGVKVSVSRSTPTPLLSNYFQMLGNSAPRFFSRLETFTILKFFLRLYDEPAAHDLAIFRTLFLIGTYRIGQCGRFFR